MNCNSCGKTNLPGGVRCVYCGTPFPPRLDFEMGAPIAPRSTPAAAARAASPQTQNARRGGLVGTLALLALKAKSIFVALKLGKILLTLSTMLISIAAYSRFFGWPFATGFVICILIHEMGHVVMNWKHGLKATAPMFIPFAGAVIFLKSFPQNPEIESESGAGGPAAGLLAALVCYLVGFLTGHPIWFALANFGALINLFNMVPFPPLDGSHIGAAFSPRIWSFVLLSLLLWPWPISPLPVETTSPASASCAPMRSPPPIRTNRPRQSVSTPYL